MNKIELGSLCITKITKIFKIKGKDIMVPKGTYVTVCDNYIKEGFVLVECEDFGVYAVDYKLDELTLVKKN